MSPLSIDHIPRGVAWAPLLSGEGRCIPRLGSSRACLILQCCVFHMKLSRNVYLIFQNTPIRNSESLWIPLELPYSVRDGVYHTKLEFVNQAVLTQHLC